MKKPRGNWADSMKTDNPDIESCGEIVARRRAATFSKCANRDRVKALTLREYSYDLGDEKVWPAAWGDCPEGNGYITTPDSYKPFHDDIPANHVDAPVTAPTPTPATKPAYMPSMSDLYRYTGYSTRRDERGKGRLMLNLANAETGEIFTAFFNCGITYQRGAERGKYFKTGRSGRFWLLSGSKFTHLWRQAVGEPERWSTVYRQMKHLKSVEFGGQVNHSKSYKEVIDLKVVAKL